MKAPIYLFICLMAWAYTAHGQDVAITEISNNNSRYAPDEEGDYNDWIELFNHSQTDTLSLKGYYLSDDEDDLEKWALPDVKIYPRSFVVVQASGKDRRQQPHHWETVAHGDSSWTYTTPYNQSMAEYLQWNMPNFAANGWLQGPGPWGYGYSNVQSETPADRYSIFMRKEFNIKDTSKIMAAVFHAFYDDGFIMYINGYEVIRENIIHNGVKPYWNMSAFRAHTSDIEMSGAQAKDFTIAPALWKALLVNGKNTIALQVHNFWDHMPMLIQPWLSLAIADTLYQNDSLDKRLPITHLPLHTNFSIGNKGEDIFLYHKSSNSIDQISVPQLPLNISCGAHWQLPSNTLAYFEEPTPGTFNSQPKKGMISDSVFLSTGGGIYQAAVEINISPAHPNYSIRYTTDGSAPRDTSKLFTAPFSLDTNAVVRAAYFKDSLLHGPISSAAYIVKDTNYLDVVSIMIEPEDFYSEEKGIYAYGKHYQSTYPYFEANFWQPWERPVWVQHFDTEAQLLWEQQAGIKIHGNYSRAYNQKSFGLYAKKTYGKKTFPYPLFADKAHIHTPKRFVLRNAGNDMRNAHLRDMLIHQRMKHSHADIQSAHSVVAYVNAKYWGVYHLREKVDRFYLRDNWGVNPDSLNLLEEDGEIISGRREGFERIMRYVRTHNMQSAQAYDWAQEQLDIPNWIDFYITHLYHHNTDWPHNNTKFWNSPHRPWRQIVVDVDVSTNINSSYNAPALNSLSKIHADTVSYSAIIYKALLQNEDYKRQYINRFADLINTIFLPKSYHHLLDSIVEIMDRDMLHQSERWFHPHYPNWQSTYIKRLERYIDEKPTFMRRHLRHRYGLGSYDTLSLHFAQTQGHIQLNSISVDTTNWTGLYYDSIPVSLAAIPNPGYHFVGWQSATSPQLADSGRIISSHFLKPHDEITALFAGASDTLDIAFGEIAYKKYDNADADDWIELINRENSSVDMSGWTIRTAIPYKQWQLPDNVVVAAGQRLLLVRNKTLFMSIYPHLDPSAVLGDMSFGLHKEGEDISLYDKMDRLVSYISFSHATPWPVIAGDKAETIELISANTDYHQPHNWQLSCPGGTPLAPPSSQCNQSVPLLFTEINYKASDNYDDEDWVELLNKGNSPIDLSHCIFSDDDLTHQYICPDNTVLQPDSLLVIAKDTAMFLQWHKDIDKTKVLGPFSFGLSSKGENISIRNRFGLPWIDVSYSKAAPWPTNAAGTGYSIQLKDTALSMSEGSHWDANCFLGTPTQLPQWCVRANSILISELKYKSRPDSFSGDWIELYNSNTRAVDLSEWSVIYGHDTLSFAPNFVIAPEAYALLVADSLPFVEQYPHLDMSAVCFSDRHFDLDKERGQLMMLNQWQHPGNRVQYDVDLGWPMMTADTSNHSLELTNYHNSLPVASWRMGCKDGSPLEGPDSCIPNVGIDEWERLGLRLVLFPNPAHTQLHMQVESQSAQNIEWQLCNIHSQAVSPEQAWQLLPGMQHIKIDVKDMPAGVYYIRIYNKQWQAIKKLIIKH